jgi:hypothetical protein
MMQFWKKMIWLKCNCLAATIFIIIPFGRYCYGPQQFCFPFCSDMGCHIDGFIAVVAHTHVIANGPVTGRAADVLAAANTAAEVAMRLVRPGKKV